MIHYQIIASELNVAEHQVKATVDLMDGGATVPFISRYRKEVTGSLDEVEITTIKNRIQQLREFDKRKESIIKSLKETGNYTDEIAKKIEASTTLTEIEDIYLPFRPKRRTKATIAKEKGLEPLAKLLFEQGKVDVDGEASKYINQEKEVVSIEEALSGARDIIAEWVSENAEVRQVVRDVFWKYGVITSKLISSKEVEAQKFKDYFEWSEPISKVPSHRLLAIRRGEKETFLTMDISPESDLSIESVKKKVITSNTAAAQQVEQAVQDSYKRLIKPSIETEIRLESKKIADIEAINVFKENLKELLMASPLGSKRVLALDPGFRSGCKVVCLDERGKLLHNSVIYPHEPQKDIRGAALEIKKLCDTYNIEAIAIGNGTAGRETETFVNTIGLDKKILVVQVNESGASIYSASEVARDEFPDHDVTVRGAVSIGRRLMDPLAELVKIDPKSIGVGQYQHDVDQNLLKDTLDDTVISSVNKVGVEVNTASKQLLTYVSGLGPQLAQNIVEYRNENGSFKSRSELKKVPRMGDKAYEQCAGFLRIRNATNLLDNSAVHPERYDLVKRMAKDQSVTVEDLIKNEAVRKNIKLPQYVSAEVGLPTLTDIVAELAKPGRDPREVFEAFSFQEGVSEIKHLKVGMTLAGIVTNVTNFGAFVDIGVHQDGLVHISELSNTYVSDPKTVVKVQQKVEVTVKEVDVARKRIALSMKTEEPTTLRPKNKVAAPKEEQVSMHDKLAMLKGRFK